VIGIGVMLLVLDVPMALLVLLGFLPLIFVTRWFYLRSQET
jgi:ATP-binding cassette, subfamily B, bacterial